MGCITLNDWIGKTTLVGYPSTYTEQWRTDLYNAPRGTSDILPEDQMAWSHVRNKASSLASLYGYHLLETPLFETTNLFTRGVGQSTDIVEKEMYTFEDRGGDSLTLRPEGTAPVCRAYLEHGMHNLPQPVRMYYLCPIFRYERPQAGRYRQHHQFGVEVLGDSDPTIDAEIIDMAWRLMNDLGLKDLSLLINTIGDTKCRPRYIAELKSYYSSNLNQLCADCQNRFERNPLRLLDCKQKSCISISDKAPQVFKYLCQECAGHWQELVSHLESLNIPFIINPKLVRGFDYYTRTVFEIQPAEESGQSNICGGGRYDGLMEQIGGPPTPGIGFGIGLERLILNLKRQKISFPITDSVIVLIASLGEDAKRAALTIASDLRDKGIGTILGPSKRSLRAQMRYANTANVPYVLVIGDEEITKGTIVIRNMKQGTQQEVTLSEALTQIQNQP